MNPTDENKVIAFLKSLGFSYDVKQDVYAKKVKVYLRFLGFIPYSSYTFQILADFQHDSLILKCEDGSITFSCSNGEEQYINDKVKEMEDCLRANYKTILCR